MTRRAGVIIILIVAGVLFSRALWHTVPGRRSVAHGQMTSPTSSRRMPNRLINEHSPYLQQHAHNPVDWYPWGEEAFAAATQTQKPILLSIGYSTCHWCHVMERESFEDPEIAALMNAQFVNIKVDREEHPDVDQVYMHAVTMLTGQGGWPLTVFLTPGRRPFFGGTYFPPARRGHLPAFREVLLAVSQAWADKREEVTGSADHFTDLLREQLSAVHPGAITEEVIERSCQQAIQAFDPRFGGFGDAPKFPRSHELSWLLHAWARRRDPQLLTIVMTTLSHIARGGIHDHLGGGFHRYSTDAHWLVPHFEKMLYDQALLARTFVEAYQVTREAWCLETARGIFNDVLRDLTDPQGGFYAAQDADSEGAEGAYYVWRPYELTDVLGREEGELIAALYGVTPEGNFSAEGESARGGEHGKSILHLAQPLEAFASARSLDLGELRSRVTISNQKLLAARQRRVPPHRDEKILTSWNGLMIASLAYGASAMEEPRYLEAATRAAEFLLRTVRRDGQLFRRSRDGDVRLAGTLEDYAFLSYGLLELYQAGGQTRWLSEARTLVREMIDKFWDAQAGGWWLRSRADEPLIAAAKEVYDGATPAGTSIAALVCLRLGRLLADAELESYGRRTLEAHAAAVAQAPFSSAQLLIAWDMALGPMREVVIAGDPAEAETRRMRRVVARQFLPRTVVAFHVPGPEAEAAQRLMPYLKAQTARDGRATAYVCERYVCQRPVTRAEELEALLQPPPTGLFQH